MSQPDEATIRARVREALRQHLESQGDSVSPPPASAPSRPVVDEATISALAEGSRLPIAPGTLITPLARDMARTRRITLEESSTTIAPQAVSRPAPAGGRAVAIGADHGGVALKAALVPHLEAAGYKVIDVGPFDEQSVDYPDYAYAVARLVSEGQAEAGIMIDGVGIGSCMVANKVPGVRAGLCYDVSTARNAREHNHANYLTLGGQLIGPLLAKQIVTAWLDTPFGPDRHARRVAKIDEVEQRYYKKK